MDDSGERMSDKKLWPLEADPNDPDVPHVTVPCANCPTHLFVAKDDPRLPDGPFFCLDHMDTVPVFEKRPDHSEADLICDRCGAKLTVRGSTREDAIAKLWKHAEEKKWTSTFNGAPQDLCDGCTTAL